jgi:sRNA-binding carbon storage regulator CsrA
MLVLTISPGKLVEIKAPNMPTIYVKSLDHSSVKLGFDAPREVQIIREDATNKEPRQK